MILSRDFRGAAGEILQLAARIVAAGLIVATMFAVAWAGLPAFAGSSAPRSRASASPSAAPVKYYIVPKARSGSTESLYEIAARTLGDGSRYPEIFALNKGRPQPGGGRLENPRVIDAGWILQLPEAAAGPGVHFGRLPVVKPLAVATVPHRRSQPAAAASSASSFSTADAVGWALIAVAVAGLAVALGRRARRLARRRGVHGRKPGARTGNRAGSALAVTGTASAIQPAWPAASYHGLLGADHPSWPGSEYPAALGPDHPSWPAGPGLVPLTPLPAMPPGGTQRLARAASPVALARHERAISDGQAHAFSTHAPATGRDRATSLDGPFAVNQPGELIGPIRQQVQDHGTADSVRLADQILAEADKQAAKIVTTAELEAAEIKQFAAQRAAEAVTTAEREAAELRAAVTKMTAELTGVAAHITENLAAPAKAAAPPAAESVPKAVTEPQTRPAAKAPRRDAARNLAGPSRPAARPGTRPGISPRRTPPARPAAKPQGRQVRAWHKMIAAMVVLFLVGIASAATEVGLHGFSFFAFRNAGAGAGNSRNLNEDQGPGQPDAPGTRHKTSISKQSSKASKPG